MSAHDGTPLRVPGITTRAPEDTAAARAALRTASACDDWIFSSPAAVRFAAKLWPRIRPSRATRVFAIGTGTARALARLGMHGVIVPGRSDSEGLLALNELRAMRGRRVALIGAPGGRDLIAPALRRRGAKVARIDVYRRAPARLTRRHFDALAAAPDPLITLLSSAEGLANLVALLPEPLLDRLRSSALVVSSERLAAAARKHGFADVHRARSAASADLLAGAESALARHRL